MLALELLAEQKIAEAIERGELDALPGAGRPLELDDDALVPEELRMAHRILKNAGYLPPELPERAKAARKLELLQMKLEPRYYRKVIRKLCR
jgi:DnaJ-like protein